MEEAAIVALEISLAAALDEWAGMGQGWGSRPERQEKAPA